MLFKKITLTHTKHTNTTQTDDDKKFVGVGTPIRRKGVLYYDRAENKYMELQINDCVKVTAQDGEKLNINWVSSN